MKKYNCLKCDKSFTQQKNLDYHLNKKKSCDAIIETSKNKKINAKTLREYIEDLKCIYCEKEFSRKDSVVGHIKNNCKKVKEIEETKNKLQEEEENKIKRLEEENLKLKNALEHQEKITEKKSHKETISTNLKFSKIEDKLNKFEYENEILKKQNLKLTALLTEILDNKKKPEILENKDSNSDYEDELICEPNGKKKKTKIPHAMRIKVWNKHIGENIGKAKCMCCKEEDITQLKFDCGHIIAESKGGKMTINNLLPICKTCNSSMGNMNMHDYQKLIKEMQEE
jgi:hypothetical protein